MTHESVTGSQQRMKARPHSLKSAMLEKTILDRQSLGQGKPGRFGPHLHWDGNDACEITARFAKTS